MTENTQQSDDGPQWNADEEIFIWQALLAVAQGRAASADQMENANVYAQTTGLTPAAANARLFAQDCMAKAIALWEEYETTIEGGPF